MYVCMYHAPQWTSSDAIVSNKWHVTAWLECSNCTTVWSVKFYQLYALDFTAKSIAEHHQSLTRCGVTLSDDFIQCVVIMTTTMFLSTAVYPASVIGSGPHNCSTAGVTETVINTLSQCPRLPVLRTYVIMCPRINDPTRWTVDVGHTHVTGIWVKTRHIVHTNEYTIALQSCVCSVSVLIETERIMHGIIYFYLFTYNVSTATRRKESIDVVCANSEWLLQILLSGLHRTWCRICDWGHKLVHEAQKSSMACGGRGRCGGSVPPHWRRGMERCAPPLKKFPKLNSTWQFVQHFGSIFIFQLCVLHAILASPFLENLRVGLCDSIVTLIDSVFMCF